MFHLYKRIPDAGAARIARIRFKPNNYLLVGQDFSWWYDLPTDVTFEVVERTDEALTLQAPGYGGTPYGNGNLYLYIKQSRHLERLRPAHTKQAT